MAVLLAAVGSALAKPKTLLKKKKELMVWKAYFDGRPVTTIVFFAVGPAELLSRSARSRQCVILDSFQLG